MGLVGGRPGAAPPGLVGVEGVVGRGGVDAGAEGRGWGVMLGLKAAGGCFGGWR